MQEVREYEEQAATLQLFAESALTALRARKEELGKESEEVDRKIAMIEASTGNGVTPAKKRGRPRKVEEKG